MQQVFQEPVPLANSDTGLLFEARVIGAKPIPFPGSTADDLIIGGENGIFFVPVTRAGLQPPSVSDGGPVLEAGATLVTGQTPTVSVADFDMDGLQDIIAGTSEGRIMLSRGSSNGGHAPSFYVGDGVDEEERWSKEGTD